MPTSAQINVKTATPFECLVWRLADHFPECDSIRPLDLPELTDDDIAVVLNFESGIGIDAARPAQWADILNSAIYTTAAERNAALAQNLRDALTHEVRDFLSGEVMVELANREHRYGGIVGAFA